MSRWRYACPIHGNRLRDGDRCWYCPREGDWHSTMIARDLKQDGELVAARGAQQGVRLPRVDV